MTTLTDRCDEAMARAIWSIRREDEDKCDMELEDMGTQHSVREEARAARLAMLAVLDVEGWQVVPGAVTQTMIVAVRRLDWTSSTDIDWPEGYAAMLAGAPRPFPEDVA
ncbi:MAG TPA: hypothetical protein VN702_17720 [Acetobacteraceae bacterium]|nr:hypothetical protein [Acetobacteraceae bacterium]